jgi:deoxyribodipyrimidine photo-lyase
VKTKDIIADLADQSDVPDFTPTRDAGLTRLSQFAGRTGDVYDRCRNYDLGPGHRANVSAFSPWIRHRLMTETEVLGAVLKAHDFQKAERFVYEIFWRTYFKGWLEQHPTVWPAYQAGLLRQIKSVDKDRRLAANYAAAMAGETGIECFDAWADELVATGYLHNHARMWFASIWCFTLRLPWELGADLFLRHLMDGDPASNTLAWRWVAGLQTKGRPYIARPSNIAKFTNGRFRPTHQLVTDVEPLTESAHHLRRPLPDAVTPAAIKTDYLLLITEDDMQIGDALAHPPIATIGALATHGRSPLPLGGVAQAFAEGAMRAACGKSDVIDHNKWSGILIEACDHYETKTIVTGYAPIGPVATALANAQPDLTGAGITIVQARRAFDTTAWPHATKGFFAMKKGIPLILKQLCLSV